MAGSVDVCRRKRGSVRGGEGGHRPRRQKAPISPRTLAPTACACKARPARKSVCIRSWTSAARRAITMWWVAGREPGRAIRRKAHLPAAGAVPEKERLWVDGGTANWNEEWVDWQYACGAAVAPAAYRKIRVTIDYDENLNEAQIGAVSLTKEYYGQNFAYDEKDNVTAVSTLLGEKDKAVYDKFDNLTSYVQRVGMRTTSIPSTMGIRTRRKSSICRCAARRPWGWSPKRNTTPTATPRKTPRATKPTVGSCARARPTQQMGTMPPARRTPWGRAPW